ncbi:hypothetical protein M0R45_007402 [Rubus argutus]|uniref:Uncharacterized protein n=1 Tax=Rubus argutus TaxID=59490 RepID=A0AAW1XZ24_RUBAR
MDSAFDGQDSKGGIVRENAIPGVKSSRNVQGICKTLAEVKSSRNMQSSLLKMYLQQVAEIVIGRMLSGVCFGILDPFMIPIIDNRIVIPYN